MALRSGFKLAAAVGRGRVARAAVMPWRVAGVARVVPAVRAFATQFGDAEGAVEDDHPVDDCTRAGKFKEMFAELQNIEHVRACLGCGGWLSPVGAADRDTARRCNLWTAPPWPCTTARTCWVPFHWESTSAE